MVWSNERHTPNTLLYKFCLPKYMGCAYDFLYTMAKGVKNDNLFIWLGGKFDKVLFIE